VIGTSAFLEVNAWKRARSWRLVLCGVAVHACGPSFEAIQEGDLRFAHCDRLDIDPNIAPSHRLHCWREWRRVYTYGQTRDRVEYAQRRIAEVVSGDTEPPFELPHGASADPRRPLPAPVSPPAPVEPIEGAPPAPESGAGVTPESAAPVAAASAKALDAEAECRARCEAERSACMPGCETKPTGCTPCEPSFEDCLEICGSAR
jgi:hypothetical protein